MSCSWHTLRLNRARSLAGIVSSLLAFVLVCGNLMAQSADVPTMANAALPPPSPDEIATSNSADLVLDTNQPVQTDTNHPLPAITNQPVQAPAPPAPPPAAPVTTNQAASTQAIQPLLDGTNAASTPTAADLKKFHEKLAAAQNLVTTRQFALAEPALVALLVASVPDDVRKQALFDLATAVEGENDLPRAQSILAQYLDKWQGDSRTPEILLRQGQLFRQMGLNNLALGKFYGVMTVALSLRDDQLAFYQKLVLQAQVEIAETHYLMGQFDDAADFYTRLLKHTDTALNRPLAQFRLVRSLAVMNHTQDAIGAAQDFLARYPDDPEEPEVRYYLAQALKASGQNGEALRQVLFFLKEEREKAKEHPDVWSYWQQRVGNEIANELYQEGDYVKALQVYMSLAELDPAPAWQVPVNYQVGITYEHLMQPRKAVDTYKEILTHEAEMGTNASPGLKAVFDMSRWRINFLDWQQRAQNVTQSMAPVSTHSAATEITTQ